jgi:hypothetical protein
MGYRVRVFAVPRDALATEAALEAGVRSVLTKLGADGRVAVAGSPGGWTLAVRGPKPKKTVDRKRFRAGLVAAFGAATEICYDDKIGVHWFCHERKKARFELGSAGPYLCGDVDGITVPYPQRGFDNEALRLLHARPERELSDAEASAIMDYQNAVRIGLAMFYADGLDFLRLDPGDGVDLVAGGPPKAVLDLDTWASAPLILKPPVPGDGVELVVLGAPASVADDVIARAVAAAISPYQADALVVCAFGDNALAARTGLRLFSLLTPTAYRSQREPIVDRLVYAFPLTVILHHGLKLRPMFGVERHAADPRRVERVHAVGPHVAGTIDVGAARGPAVIDAAVGVTAAEYLAILRAPRGIIVKGGPIGDRVALDGDHHNFLAPTLGQLDIVEALAPAERWTVPPEYRNERVHRAAFRRAQAAEQAELALLAGDRALAIARLREAIEIPGGPDLRPRLDELLRGG